eukprot:1411065-Prymnesium_polylepis.1
MHPCSDSSPLRHSRVDTPRTAAPNRGLDLNFPGVPMRLGPPLPCTPLTHTSLVLLFKHSRLARNTSSAVSSDRCVTVSGGWHPPRALALERYEG